MSSACTALWIYCLCSKSLSHITPCATDLSVDIQNPYYTCCQIWLPTTLTLFFSHMMTCFLIIINWLYRSTSVGVLVRRRETAPPILAFSLRLLVGCASNSSVPSVQTAQETAVEVRFRWMELAGCCNWYQSLHADFPGGIHRLGSFEKARDEAKRLLQSNTDSLKTRQEKLRGDMKYYDELTEKLKMEHNDTMVEIRRHKEKQVTRDDLFLCLVPLCCVGDTKRR